MRMQQNSSPSSASVIAALNNVAIELLERQMFLLATETLENAKSLIEQTATARNPPRNVREFVQRAMQHLSQPTPPSDPQFTMSLNVVTATAAGRIEQAQQHQKSCTNKNKKTSTLHTILADVPSSDAAFLIRMQDGIHRSCRELILMHNLSVAYSCLWQQQQQARTGRGQDDRCRNTTPLLELALRYSHSASLPLFYSLKSNTTTTTTNPHEQHSSMAHLQQHQQQDLYALSLVCLNTLFQIQRDLQLCDGADETYGLLVELRLAAATATTTNMSSCASAASTGGPPTHVQYAPKMA